MIKCKFENGNEAQLRHVTVGALVINESNEILLTKRAPDLLRGNKYAIPGGFLDRDETTADAATRELFEETGIEGKVEFLFKIEDRPERLNEEGNEGRQNIDFIYVVKAAGGSFRENNEVSEIKWFSENSIPDEEEFAFDHRWAVAKYFEYMKKSFPVPLIGGLI